MRESGVARPLTSQVTRIISLLVVTILSAAVPIVAQGPPEAGEYIVTFRPGTSRAARATAANQGGAVLRFNYAIVDAVAVTIPNVNAYVALQRNPAVLQILPDHQIEAFHHRPGHGGGPSGGGGSDGGDGGNGGTGGGSVSSATDVVPLGVKRVREPTDTSNGQGIGVAIVDTGIDLSHADLAVAAAKFDAFGGSCQDGNGHGTHVAGTVAALANHIDVRGVAPLATPYCVRVLNNSGSGSDSTVIAGLDCVAGWAGIVTDPVVCSPLGAGLPPVRVVNMSLGKL